MIKTAILTAVTPAAIEAEHLIPAEDETKLIMQAITCLVGIVMMIFQKRKERKNGGN